MKIGLLRESGGIGDIISISGAATALKREYENCEIVCFVPLDFCDYASHLGGVDRVVPLLSVSELAKCRRIRDSNPDVRKYKYLEPLLREKCDKIVDLYCPGFYYEQSTTGREEYTRPQLFAIAAGCKKVLDAGPVWNCRSEEIERARKFLSLHSLQPGEYIISNLRGTCSNRVYPAGYAHEVLSELVARGEKIVYGDVMRPHFPPLDSFVFVREPLPVFVALVAMAKLVLCMDSSLLHIAQAMGVRSVSLHIMSDGFPYDKWYNTRVVEPEVGGACEVPCHYNHSKGWDQKKCRPAKCVRIPYLTPDLVLSAVCEELRKISSASSRMRDIPTLDCV